MRSLILAVFLLATAALGQEARVIQIKSEDSVELKQKWEVLQVAQKSWDEANGRIKKDYIVVKEGDKDAGRQVLFAYDLSGSKMAVYWTSGIIDGCNMLWADSTKPRPQEDAKRCEEIQRKAEKNRASMLFYRNGWESGFEFTPDFRFIVPRKPEPPKPNSSYPFIQFAPAYQAIQ